MSDTHPTPGQATCTFRVSPDAVDAGADLTLIAAVSCAPPRDLRGHTLSVRDQAGNEVAGLELVRFDGSVNETNERVVKAPDGIGSHTWVAVCPAFVKKGTSYAEASAAASFTVAPHTTSIVVWDIPPAIVAGERFRMKVGIKCSSECSLSDRALEIHDHEGRVIATVTNGSPWPGTGSLNVAEVELAAPAADGLYTWNVRASRLDATLPHTEAFASFGVRAVMRPECLVTVETIDRASQMPLSGAQVVMHPYRAVTDERGLATIRVAKGAYKLFVSQTSYLTYGVPLDVTADTTTKAELDVEPVRERN